MSGLIRLRVLWFVAIHRCFPTAGSTCFQLDGLELIGLAGLILHHSAETILLGHNSEETHIEGEPVPIIGPFRQRIPSRACHIPNAKVRPSHQNPIL